MRPGKAGEHDDIMQEAQASPFTALESKVDAIAVELAALKLRVVTDIADLKVAVGADIAGLKSDIADFKLASGADIAGLKGDIAEVRGRLTNIPTTFQVLTWFIGVAIGLTALVFTIARVVR